MNDPDDAQLVRAAQAGDVTALGTLLERYRAQMKAVAVSLLGHHPDTEDVVQDACIQALRHIQDIHDPAAVRAWLVAVVANGCRAQLRRRRPVVMATPPREDLIDSVEQAVERSAVRDWLWTALERLTVPHRTVVMLRYFSDASSYATIAELCDIPVGTVRSRLHNARAQIAEQLFVTTESAHRPDTTHRRLAQDAAHALDDFQTTGNPDCLAGCFGADLRFTLADGVPDCGRDRFAALLAADMNDGVRGQPIRVTAGPDIAIVELRLVSPSDHPLHCPPGLTQIHFHDNHRIRHIKSHYATEEHPPKDVATAIA